MILGMTGQLQAAIPGVEFDIIELRSQYKEMLLFDYNRDNFDDIILSDKQNLICFLQDSLCGFTSIPQLIYPLGNKPMLLWPTPCGDNLSQGLLMMTNTGVSSLTYVNKDIPFEKEEIINRKTLIPKTVEKTPTIFFASSANTTKEFPLIIIPTPDSIEIWEYTNATEWHKVCVLDTKLQNTICSFENKDVYNKEFSLNMSVGDINGDGRDDIVICKDSFNGEKASLHIYIQTNESTFLRKPTKSFEINCDDKSWICLLDINKDGLIDLIKNTWVKGPWFVPGIHSGKVIVCVFLADANGNILEKPQYIFRKNDWMPSVPIVDIDNDGYTDLVLGYNRWKGREEVIKSLIVKKVDYNLRFHFYDKGAYSEKPTCQKDITICLNESILNTDDFSYRNVFKTLVNFDGDFNGDGFHDMLVKDGKRRASVYLFQSRKKGFSEEVDITFDVDKVKRFIISDLNKDSISDLIIIPTDKNFFKIFLSKADSTHEIFD